MPTLLNTRHEQFAQAVARGGTAIQAYRSAGYCQNGARQNASRLRKQPHVRERIKELTANFAAAAMAVAIADKNARMRDYDKRWKRFRSVWDRVLAERSRELAHVPGGDTGFLIRQYKGKNPVYKVDTSLLALSNAMSALEEAAAKERGEWPRGPGRPRKLENALAKVAASPRL